MYKFHVCRLTSLDELPKKDRKDYDKVKTLALELGKFSSFDAYDNSLAVNLTRLCRDPEIETEDLGYPWMGVKKKASPAPAKKSNKPS